MNKGFILGNPRSGTSLLRIMLNSHNMVVAPPECGFLQWWYNKYKAWSIDDFDNGNLEKFLVDLFSSKKIETWELKKHKLRSFLINERPSNYSELTSKVYEFWALNNATTPKVIIDKNNYYLNHLYEISSVWPDACYIVLVRDGRDVACSYKKMNNLKSESPYKPSLPTSIKDIAQEWKKNHEKINQFLRDLESDRYIIIKYEELINKTQKTLTNVCQFFGEEFKKEMLSYHLKNRDKEMEPKATLDWKKKTLEKPDKSNIGKYKKILTKSEIDTFNNIATDLLKEFGYLA